MSRSNRAVRGTLLLALAAWLGSCQSTTVVEDEAPTEPPASRMSAELAFAPEIAPDSIVWKLTGAKGSQAVQDLGADSLKRRKISLQIEYGTAAGDSLWVEFRRFGLRVTTMAWVRDGAGNPFMPRVETIRRDSLGRLILRRMNAAGISGKAKADSVYANVVLDGKLEFDGFPDSVPGGMEPAKIRRLVLLQAVARRIPLGQLADVWLLDLTAAQARDSIKALVVAGLVPAADTSALYPLPRIRLVSPLSIDSAVAAGGSAQHLKGKLLCEDGIQLLQARILDDKGSDASALFAPQPARTLSGTEISLDTAGIVLQANAGTPAGAYRLRLMVLDRKPRFDSFDLAFQTVVPQVSKAPRITWVSPDKDTTHTSKDSTWLAKVRVEDSLKIDSVVIGGHQATKVGEFWQVLDTLHDWGTPVSLVAKAYNAAGRDTTVVSRKITLNAPSGDALPEVIALEPADGSDTVAFASATRKISWKFAPGGVFKDVQAVLDLGDGSPKTLSVTKTDTTWSTNVPLPPNGKLSLVKVLVVTSSNYIVPVDTFWLARKKDSIAPSINPQAPPAVVNFDSLAVTLRWKITDNHKMDTVKINGLRVLPQTIGTEIVYSYSLKLDTGTNKAKVVARDSTGNLKQDSVSVIRLHSSDPPVLLRRPGTADRSIEYRSTDSFTVAWTVTDKEMLDSVVIAGTRVKDPDGTGIFSRKVAIGPGANRIGIQAWGKYSGKSAVDTVEITTVASDADLNKYNILLMPDGRVWMTSNLRVTGGSCGIWGCDLSGRLYTWSKALGLDAAYDAKAVGSSSTSVVRGLCPAGWHVAQAKEWSALYAATLVKGSTDSALALRIDTGWGGTQGRNLWGNFLVANKAASPILKPASEVYASFSGGDSKESAVDIGAITSDIGSVQISGPITIGTTPILLATVNQSMLWAPGETSATSAELLTASASGTSSSTATKTGTNGVRCIEDSRLIIRPIGIKNIDSLVVKLPIGTKLDLVATQPDVVTTKSDFLVKSPATVIAAE
ncbi:MAG: hypothetical protein IPO40_03815 [Fibrobacteres bacterium]|nr:hypothetical protein [Fibrobacterota bacterium]